jgi:hypothetical protein
LHFYSVLKNYSCNSKQCLTLIKFKVFLVWITTVHTVYYFCTQLNNKIIPTKTLIWNISHEYNFLCKLDKFFYISVTIALAKRVSNMKIHLTNNSLFRVQRPGFWVKYSEIYSLIKSENNFSQQNGLFS